MIYLKPTEVVVDDALDPAFVEALGKVEAYIDVVKVFIVMEDYDNIPVRFYKAHADAFATLDAVLLPSQGMEAFGEDVSIVENLERWCPHWFKNGPIFARKALIDLGVDMFKPDTGRVATNPKLTAVQALDHILETISQKRKKLDDPAVKRTVRKEHPHLERGCACLLPERGELERRLARVPNGDDDGQDSDGGYEEWIKVSADLKMPL